KDPTAARLPYADIRQCKTNPVSPSLSSNLRAQPWVPSFQLPAYAEASQCVSQASPPMPPTQSQSCVSSVPPFPLHLLRPIYSKWHPTCSLPHRQHKETTRGKRLRFHHR